MAAPLDQTSTPQLLATYAAILRELRRRGIVRTANAPAGDYAEYLVAQALGGQLAPNSGASWDLLAPRQGRVQVKARVLLDLVNPQQRQLSAFRSFDFDTAAIVLFAEDYSLWRAVLLPVAIVRADADYRAHVNGAIFFAKDSVLAHPSATDLTAELWEVILTLERSAGASQNARS